MNFSVLAFLFEAFSTSSRILATVESSYSLVTSTFNKPLMLIQPLKISSPVLTSLGIDSPVKAEVSSEP